MYVTLMSGQPGPRDEPADLKSQTLEPPIPVRQTECLFCESSEHEQEEQTSNVGARLGTHVPTLSYTKVYLHCRNGMYHS